MTDPAPATIHGSSDVVVVVSSEVNRVVQMRLPMAMEFWADRPDKEQLPEVAAPAPLERFLETMRRGTPAPKIRVR